MIEAWSAASDLRTILAATILGGMISLLSGCADTSSVSKDTGVTDPGSVGTDIMRHGKRHGRG